VKDSQQVQLQQRSIKQGLHLLSVILLHFFFVFLCISLPKKMKFKAKIENEVKKKKGEI